jgi:hypothetical protein
VLLPVHICGGVGDLVGNSIVGVVEPPCPTDHVGEGGGGRKLANEMGFLGRGLNERLIVFRTGRVGGLGSRSFGIASSHLEALIEFDLATFVDPVSNKDPLGLGLWSLNLSFDADTSPTKGAFTWILSVDELLESGPSMFLLQLIFCLILPTDLDFLV